MSWLTPSRLIRIFLLLAFLTGMEFSIALMPAMAATHVIQDTRSSVGGDFEPCGKQGMIAGICYATCAPAFAIDPDIAVGPSLPSSRFWLSQDVTVVGRAVRPGLAPPRIL